MSWPILAGESPTAERLSEGWTSYTPTLTASITNPNLGSTGVAVGAWYRTGLMVVGFARFQFSGTGVAVGSGRYQISLPLPADTSVVTTSATGGAGTVVGVGRLRQNTGGTASQTVSLQVESATLAFMMQHASNTAVSEASPIAWVANDRISVTFRYPVAAGV